MAAKENIATDKNKRAPSADKNKRVTRVTSGGRLSRGSSTASSPTASRAALISSKNAATDATNSAVGSDTEPAAEVAANGGPARSAGANSKVSSLQRQLEALSARQREADIQLEAEKALAGEQSGDEGEGAGGAGERASKLEVTTRRCTELEDRVDDLEGELRLSSGGVVDMIYRIHRLLAWRKNFKILSGGYGARQIKHLHEPPLA